MNGIKVSPNQNQQAELGKLSSFLKKHSKKPPFHPIRCGKRWPKAGRSVPQLRIYKYTYRHTCI
mgnify:CR=1 FL=1